MRWRKEHKLPVFWAVLRQMSRYFCIVITITMLFNLGYSWMNDQEWLMHSDDALSLFFVVAIALLPALMFVFFQGGLFLRLLHFGLTAGIPLTYIAVFESEPGGLTLRTLIMFFVIFISIYGIGYWQDKKTAIKLNEKLNAFHRGENAVGDDENAR